MPARQRFKDLVVEARTAGFELDDGRTRYLTREKMYVVSFQREARTFIVTDWAILATSLESSKVVERLLAGITIVDLQRVQPAGMRFR